jgi:hypothetical protein
MPKVGEAVSVIRFGRSVPAVSTEPEQGAADETTGSQERTTCAG